MSCASLSKLYFSSVQILSTCAQTTIADTLHVSLSQICETMPCHVNASQSLGENTYHTDVARDKQLCEKASLFPSQTDWLVMTYLLDIIFVPNDVDRRQRDLLFVDIGQIPISDKSSSKEYGKFQRSCTLQLQTHWLTWVVGKSAYSWGWKAAQSPLGRCFEAEQQASCQWF